jgi:acetate kinase
VKVLVVNAGSSSVKLRLLDEHDVVLGTEDLPAGSSGFDLDTLEGILAGWPQPDVVGHRIVHGGPDLTSAVLIDEAMTARLTALTDLAPLHQPKSLAALGAVTKVLPDVPSVGCFDTAFHSTLPPAAYTYAVPAEWRERHGVRRYGFHGLSHAYCSRRAAEIVNRPPDGLRVVTCHLGAGASLTAVVDGRSVDTTMGFTPLEGLVMATRSGSVDPGLVLWLEEHEHLSPHEVATALEHRSGLLALAGTGDLREIEQRIIEGDAGAQAALDVYVHRIVTLIGSMAVSAGGLDVLAFTAGVGEHSALVRAQVATRLGWLGVDLDEQTNAAADGDTDLTADGAPVSTVVVAAREDLQIAQESRALMAARNG